MNRKSLPRILKELAGVDPDAAATDRALDRARSALPNPPQLSLRAQIMRPRNLGAIAAGIALIILISQLLPASGGGNFAFGQVQEQVSKTKSVQYTETRTDRMKDSKAEVETQSKVAISGPAIERRDVTTEEKNVPEGTLSLSGSSGHYISIRDAVTGKMISLFPEKKGYVRPREKMSVQDDGSIKTETIKATPKVDFYARIQEIPADPVKRLPEQIVDGKTVVGFVYEENRNSQGGEDKFTRRIWVDPKTKLPLRIEVAFRSTNPTMVDSDWVMKDFVFDAPLDQKLFSFDPPAGYIDLAKVAENTPAKRKDGKRTEFVFADVQEEVAKVRSAQYRVKEVHRATKDGPPAFETTGKVLILGDKKREEFQNVSKLPHYYDFLVGVKYGVGKARKNFSVPAILAEKIRRLEGVNKVDGMLRDAVLLREGLAVYPVAMPLDSQFIQGLTLVEGRRLNRASDHEVLLGSKLASYMRKGAGDKLQMLGEDFAIVGIYAGSSCLENGGMITTLADLERSQGTNMEGFFDSVLVTAKRPIDTRRLDELRSRITELDTDYEVSPQPSDTSSTVVVQDKQAGTMIHLDVDGKWFANSYSPSPSLGVDATGLERVMPGSEPTAPTDFYELIHTIPTDTATKVGEREINGHQCTGFVVERTRTAEDRKSEKSRHISWVDPQTDKWRRTYWIDQQTKLPVEIATSFRSDAPMSYDADAVYSDFVFNAELDPALFSMDPPAGYGDINAKISEENSKPTAK
jgi:outer membrane lipoprotein-sorting protein